MRKYSIEKVCIMPEYTNNNIDAFRNYMHTGVIQDDDLVPNILKSLPIMESADVWTIVDTLVKNRIENSDSVDLKGELLDLIANIFRLPTFLKYIDIAFIQFVPYRSVITNGIYPSAFQRSISAVTLSYQHYVLLPHIIQCKLRELNNLANFYQNNPLYCRWADTLFEIPGFTLQQECAPVVASPPEKVIVGVIVAVVDNYDNLTETDASEENSPPLVARLAHTVFVGNGYMDHLRIKAAQAETQRKQIAKLSRLAEELIMIYAPDFLTERQSFKQSLIIGLPKLIEKLFIKEPQDLFPADKENVLFILRNLLNFFQDYSSAIVEHNQQNKIGQIPGLAATPADIMFNKFNEFNESSHNTKNTDQIDIGAIIKRVISILIDKLRAVDIDENLLIIIESIADHYANQLIDNYYHPHFVLKVIERLVETDIDFDDFTTVAFSNPFSNDIDDDYSLQLGMLISELFTAINDCSRCEDQGWSDAGVEYVVKIGLYKLAKWNGDLLQQFHRDYMAGTCSMKPLTILHHLLVRRRNNRLEENYSSLVGGLEGRTIRQQQSRLQELCMDRINALARTSEIAKICQQLGLTILNGCLRTVISVASSSALLLIFAHYMCRFS